MKKVLSILLALSLIISVIPAAFAETTGEVPTSKTYELYDLDAESNISFKTADEANVVNGGYTFLREIDGTKYYSRDEYWVSHGEREWKIFDASDDTIKETFRLYKADAYLQVGKNTATVKPDFALSLQAPGISGFYIPKMKGGSATTSSVRFKWSLALLPSGESATAYKDAADLIFDSNGSIQGAEFKAEKAIYSKPEDEIISWIYSDTSAAYGFKYIKLDPILDPYMTTAIKNNDSTTSSLTLNLGDNKQQTVTLHTTVKGKDTEWADVEPIQVSNNFITYKSSNEAVATVAADGTITAVGGGEATIYAESSDGKYNSQNSGITVTVTAPAAEPEDEVADGTVSFAQTTNIAGFTGIDVASVNRGDSVTLTAHKESIPGYKFIGWKRGADTSDKNAWVDINGDSYTVWTNTYLTAIYEKETDVTEKAVEFWNQNGAYLGKKAEEDVPVALAITPKLTGFGNFLGWFIDKDVELTAETILKAGTTNAVAQYEALAVTGVTFNGNAIADADKYNAEITLPATSDETTCWKRDGEIIAYGSLYKFNVWDATNITEGTDEIAAKVPVAILDYSATHKAYMLEYDAGDYEIVEAGIIFGKDTADIKTYTSQRKEKHNQFTVPEEGELDATGYIIYTLDNGASYKTKYVSVKTVD